MSLLGLDTSVAVPLLVNTHKAHAAVVQWWDGRRCAMCGHALAETYSVLTRLPGDARLSPMVAYRLLEERFDAPLVLSHQAFRALPATLGRLGIAGGAVYDAVVGLTAAENDAVLATRDLRAGATYAAVGTQIIVAT